MSRVIDIYEFDPSRQTELERCRTEYQEIGQLLPDLESSVAIEASIIEARTRISQAHSRRASEPADYMVMENLEFLDPATGDRVREHDRALSLYSQYHLEDPEREMSLYHNSQTGEFYIGRGCKEQQ